MATTTRPRNEPTSLLAVQGLTVEFPGERGPIRVIDDVSFDVAKGEILGLVGESGSGKSVTALSLLGLIRQMGGRIAAGSIDFNGLPLHRLSETALDEVRGAHISMIFQEPMACLDPLYSIGSQIAEIARRHLKLSRRAATARAIELLDRVAIPDPARRAREYPHQLSGGMRQRAMIAMALTCDPQLLIADEPTTALDVSVQAGILDLLRTLRAELRLAVLFITHDFGVVAELCDRVAVMYAGQLLETAPVPALLSQPLHPYSAALLGSIPHFLPRQGRMTYVSGRVPPPGRMPPGCRFYARCEFRDASRCALEQHLSSNPDGRLVRCTRAAELSLRGAYD